MTFINDNNNNNQMWDWQGEDCYFVDNACFNGSNSHSNESTQNGNISYARDGETTPVKGMADHGYFVDNIENKNKRQNQWSDPYSQSKRRRVLQFDSEVIDGHPCTNVENSSILMPPNGAGDSVNEVLSQMSNWLCEDTDGTSLPCHEVLETSFEGWLSSCLTDSEMGLNPNQSSYIHNEANGIQNLQHRTESSNMTVRHEKESTTMAKHPVRVRHNSKFQGKKSFMKTSDTSSTSVVYPFSFLKPCEFSGDMTLKDINRIIHAPPKSQEATISYSAFSGKPVVAKTKLRTDGGKGSITIMRTKG